MFPNQYFDPNLEKNLNELNKLSGMTLSQIVKGALNGISTVKDTFNAGKIIDYYQMAVRAKDVYSDQVLFSHLKNESQIAYDSMNNQKMKDFVKQQVDTFVN